jgi:RNA polymerase-binding transcription factor
MKNRMSESKLKMFKQILHEMRETEIRDIEKQLGRDLDPAVIRKIDVAMDSGDWATQEQIEGIDHLILEKRYQTFKELSSAFRRMERGTYGLCENCGVGIPLDRLDVEPLTRYCVPCLTKKEEFEKAEKGVGNPPTL